jgi:lysophospholipase
MSQAPLVRAPTVSIPDGAEASFFESFDGAPIRMVRFGGSGQRGTCLIVPGWTEPAEKYAEVALDLMDRDFEAVCIDPRGQGLSHRLSETDDRGRIDVFSKYVRDLEAAASRCGEGPLVLLGHSMGGLTALSYLCGGGRADCAVLSAPATRIFPKFWQRMGARAAVSFLCRLGLQDRPLSKAGGEAMEFDGNTLTSDRTRHAMLKGLLETSDDLALPPQTPAMVRALLRQQQWLEGDGLDALGVPMTIVSAGEDSWVDSGHHQILAERSSLISLTVIEGAKHEILMERDELRDQFWDAFDRQIDAVLPLSSDART